MELFGLKDEYLQRKLVQDLSEARQVELVKTLFIPAVYQAPESPS